MMRKEKITPFDEEFAVAADDFLAGTIERTGREDAELSALLDTLERVKTAFADSDDAAARERIRSQMRRVWFEVEAERSAPKENWQTQIRDFFWQNQLQTRLSISFAMILLLFAAVPFFFSEESALAGTAGSVGIPNWLGILLVLILVATLFMLFKRQK